MPWSGSDFQRVHNFSADASAGINILATRVDEEFDGIATGLEACLKLDGSNSPQQNFAMGGFKHTNVGAATSVTEYLRLDQYQQQTPIFCTYAGTSDVFSISTSPIYSALASGHTILVSCTSANTTTSVTIKLNGGSAKPVLRLDGSELGLGDVKGLHRYTWVGTHWVLENHMPGGVINQSTTFTSTARFSGSTEFASTTYVFNGAEQYPIGYQGIPIVSYEAGRGISANDSSKCLYHTSTNTAPLRVRSCASVDFRLGTAIMIQNGPSAGVVSVSAFGGVTLFRSGTGSTGTRILSAGCDALLIKVGQDTWRISGNGLT